MEKRLNTLETDIEIIKRDISSCQSAIRTEMEHIKQSKQEIPTWLKSSAVGIIGALFFQTISSVWWASSITSTQEYMQNQVNKNSNFIAGWPAMHEEVMIGLREIQIDNKNMKEMLHEIKKQQRTIEDKHTTDLH